MKTKENVPFWSGQKRCPNPLKFDENNKLHLEFVKTAAKLRAVNYGLKATIQGDEDQYYKKIANSTEIPKWQPKKGFKVTLEDEKKEGEEQQQKEEEEEETDIDQAEVDKLLNSIPKASSLAGYRMTPIEFEKDDPTNHHIDFITACSNLRATNYKISTANKHKTKGIAGKIIPAMVTTTAAVTGLACIELIKLAQDEKRKDIECFSNAFLNLALPYFGFSEPMPAPKTKITDDWSWTNWDRFDVVGPLTLAQLLQHFEKKYKLEISMISADVSLLYSSWMPQNKQQARLKMEVSKILESITKKEIPKFKKYLVLQITADLIGSDDDIDVPSVRYQFRA